jgi:hypothetical protein
MRVLLVNTNRMRPSVAPIGLDYVSDSLIAVGHEPKLLDLCFSTDIPVDVESAVSCFQPDVIGVTIRNTDDCYFSGGAFFVPEIKEIIDILRQCSDAPIVLGGVGFSVAPFAVMEFCGSDYGIAGEGEQGFVAFLDAWRRRSGFERVPNLLWREGGSIRRNPSVHIDLDSLPPRPRSFPDNARYFREGGQAGFETKRGCNMTCVYCADPVSKGRHVRLRSPKLVADELKALLAQGIDHFHTCDCEFNIPGDHAKEVCRAIIDSGLGDTIRWYAYCSVTPFDAEMADLFKRAGCAGVDFGADSGSDEMLRRLGRSFRSEDLARTADLCHQYGITFMYDLLLGGPGDTRETVRESIEFMRRIDADCVGLAMGMRIYDGTAVAEAVRAEGDPACNANLYGAKEDNPFFLKPVFYIAPELGAGIVDYVREVVGDDTRFFLPSNEEVESNYNYNDNTVLVNAIRNGARGAYWDILRRM